MTEPQATTEVPKDNETPEPTKKATNLIIVGMAGSGKTTFMQRITSHLHGSSNPGYVINLDPAVTYMPFSANIDIRDTVKYKNVMKQYGLGPNGAIITSLNLFATRFDQVLQFVEKRNTSVEYVCYLIQYILIIFYFKLISTTFSYVLVDTPGQIEVFNWSASGTIITEAIASLGPTVMVYIVDTARSTNPSTFMSNMLYACSILYKSKLPLIVVFNKVDVVRHDFALEWMSDCEKFEEATMNDETFMSSLTRSMGMVLEEFYQNMRTVGFSAITGEGINEFFEAVDGAAEEYETEYKVLLREHIKKQKEMEAQKQKENLEKFRKDLEENGELPDKEEVAQVKSFIDMMSS